MVLDEPAGRSFAYFGEAMVAGLVWFGWLLVWFDTESNEELCLTYQLYDLLVDYIYTYTPPCMMHFTVPPG